MTAKWLIIVTGNTSTVQACAPAKSGFAVLMNRQLKQSQCPKIQLLLASKNQYLPAYRSTIDKQANIDFYLQGLN